MSSNTKKKSGINRTIKGSQKIYHDLFKLKPAGMEKEIMIGNDKVLKDIVMHQHFYHTVDSSGRSQNECSPIGGHTHRMEVYTDSKGNLQAKCSGPFVRTKVKQRGRTIEKILDSTKDFHTHQVEYIESTEITLRKPNAEAIKAMSFFNSPDNPEAVNGQADEN